MLYLAVLRVNKPKLYIQKLRIRFSTSRGRCKNSKASPTDVLRRDSEREWGKLEIRLITSLKPARLVREDFLGAQEDIISIRVRKDLFMV